MTLSRIVLLSIVLIILIAVISTANTTVPPQSATTTNSVNPKITIIIHLPSNLSTHEKKVQQYCMESMVKVIYDLKPGDKPIIKVEGNSTPELLWKGLQCASQLLRDLLPRKTIETGSLSPSNTPIYSPMATTKPSSSKIPQTTGGGASPLSGYKEKSSPLSKPGISHTSDSFRLIVVFTISITVGLVAYLLTGRW